MQTKFVHALMVKIFLTMFLFSVLFSCKKDSSTGTNPQSKDQNSVGSNASKHHDEGDEDENNDNDGKHCPTTPPFNFNAILHGSEHGFGLILFRQDPDPAQIVTLDTWVFGLEPNHTYQLQRAVDVFDCNCTSTGWLILGNGTTPLVIQTDSRGFGKALFSRNLSAVAPGTTFDIHFQVVDVASASVVLTSSCHQFMVR
jgi:hypothetical protein